MGGLYDEDGIDGPFDRRMSKPPPVLKIVLAPDRRAFAAWCRETGTAPRDAVYVGGRESLLGRNIRQEDVVVTVDAYLHPRFFEIVDALAERGVIVGEEKMGRSGPENEVTRGRLRAARVIASARNLLDALEGLDATPNVRKAMAVLFGDLKAFGELSADNSFAMRLVKSSTVAAIGYDPGTLTLRVAFKNGATYDYGFVEPEVAAEVAGASSVGSALNRLVKAPKYPYRIVASHAAPPTVFHADSDPRQDGKGRA